MLKIIKNKSAVIFGMDARITLAITSIMLLVVGINQFTKFEKADYQKVQNQMGMIKEASLLYYRDYYSFASITTLLNSQYLQLDTLLNEDPWGVAYVLGWVENDETINGQTMTVKYYYIKSAGKDGTDDTSAPTTKSEWNSASAVNDDVLLKFTSLEIEKEISEIERSQLEIVKDLLEKYAQRKEAENVAFCVVEDNQLNVMCDVDQDATYDDDEELNLNYMPAEQSDSDSIYYVASPFYKSGYINLTVNAANNMYAFINLIGGNENLVTTPRGQVLHFNPNQYGNTQAPYFGRVWYGAEETVF